MHRNILLKAIATEMGAKGAVTMPHGMSEAEAIEFLSLCQEVTAAVLCGCGQSTHAAENGVCLECFKDQCFEDEIREERG